MDTLERLLFPGGLPSWEQPDLQSLNRLPPRATLVSFPSPEAAATFDRRATTWHRSLEGAWDFKLADRPAAAPSALRLARGWDTVDVPSLWTMLGYDRPHYTNVQMPFAGLPPTIPELNQIGRAHV